MQLIRRDRDKKKSKRRVIKYAVECDHSGLISNTAPPHYIHPCVWDKGVAGRVRLGRLATLKMNAR